MENITPKANKIIGTGRDLFFKHGLHRITVEEICKTAGVSKKTFYNHFSNKYELAKLILDDINRKELSVIETHRARSVSFLEKITAMMEESMANIWSSESTFFKEAYENCAELRPFIDEQIIKRQTEILNFFKEEKARGEIRKEVPPELVVYLLTDLVRHSVLDPKLDNLLPDMNERLRMIIGCLITGVSTESCQQGV